MTGRIVTYLFILAMLSAGCAQTPSGSLSPGDLSESGKNPAAISSGPSPQPGHIDDSTQQTLIEQIMEESGLNEMIEQMPAMAAMGFDQQQPPPLNRDKYEKFREIFLETFEAEKIRETILTHFNEQYDQERYSEFLALIRTPLIQKMMALEIAESTPQAQQDMIRNGNIIMGQASQKRLDFARRLDEVTGATEMTLDTQIMVAGAMITNMNMIMPPEQRLTDKQVEQMLGQMRLQSRFPARQYTHLSFVYMYRSVSDEELEKYIQTYETEIGRWGTKLMRDAWMKVSEEISADLAEQMKDAFIESNVL